MTTLVAAEKVALPLCDTVTLHMPAPPVVVTLAVPDMTHTLPADALYATASPDEA